MDSDQSFHIQFKLASSQFDQSFISTYQFPNIFQKDQNEYQDQWLDSLIDRDDKNSESILKSTEVRNPPAQEVRLTKRVNNTIFKTSLSQYRKSIIDQIKADSSLWWLRETIKQVCRAKNQSVFPKLNFIVRWLRLEAINKRWSNRGEKLLKKKEKQVLSGNYKIQRYKQLQESIKSMNQCLEQPQFQKVIERYWGNYTQKLKYKQCQENIITFCEDFKKKMQSQSNKKFIVYQKNKIAKKSQRTRILKNI